MSDMSIDLLLITSAISLKAQNGKKIYMINIYGKQVTHSTHFVNEVQNSIYKWANSLLCMVIMKYFVNLSRTQIFMFNQMFNTKFLIYKSAC